MNKCVNHTYRAAQNAKITTKQLDTHSTASPQYSIYCDTGKEKEWEKVQWMFIKKM